MTAPTNDNGASDNPAENRRWDKPGDFVEVVNHLMGLNGTEQVVFDDLQANPDMRQEWLKWLLHEAERFRDGAQ